MRQLSPGRVRIFLVLLVAFLGLFFLWQPFHIDDRIYLEIADNVRANPLFPYDYTPFFEGLITPDAASHSHLPLTSYYLAAVQWLSGGEAEWLCHLAFLIFPILLAVGFYDLAGRFCVHPAAATLLLVVSPGVLVLSHTLMTEVPVLAFWTLAVARFLRILEGSSRRMDLWICAAGLLGVASISLLGVGLIILLLAALILKWRESGQGSHADPAIAALWKNPRFRNALLLLCLPLAVWFLWYLRAYLHYDRFVLIRTFQHLDKREAFAALLLGGKFLSFVLNLGGALTIPVAAWLAFTSRRRALAALGAGFLGGLVIWLRASSDWTAVESLLFLVMLSSGFLVLPAVVRELWPGWFSQQPEGRQRLVLLFWFLGILTANVLLYPSGSVRYALLAFPPVCLVWARSMDRLNINPYFRRNLIWACVVAATFYSLVVARADYRMASMYRDLAREIVHDYQQPGRQIWFTAEWGLRYYLEQSGARLLLRTSVEPAVGDIIVKPYVASPWVTLYDGSEYTDLLEQREAQMGSRIRILDFFSHAGFYSTAWGILPFSFGRDDRWEWVNVFQIKKEYDGPLPEPERHY